MSLNMSFCNINDRVQIKSDKVNNKHSHREHDQSQVLTILCVLS